jgi:hypothetical protein
MQGSLTAEGIKGFVPSESVAMMLLVLKNRKGEALRSFTAVKIGTNIGISHALDRYQQLLPCCPCAVCPLCDPNGENTSANLFRAAKDGSQ